MGKTLVVGGTGKVGSNVTDGLLARGEQARVLTRSGKVAAGEAAIGSLEDSASLKPAMAGVDRLFLLTPLSPTETEQGLAGVEAAKAAGVKKIVFLSVHQLRDGREIPHFASKIPIEEAIVASGIPYTILAPNNFYQNDLGVKDIIVNYGVYPQPIGPVGCSRVDVRDIADAAVNALLDSGHDGKTYPLVGPELWTGESTAAAFSSRLGKTIHYVGDDLERWAQMVSSSMPEWLVHDLVIMYAYFQKHGLVASEADYASQARVLGHAPRPFAEFLAENF